jgi:hypothetical protein
LLPSGRKGTLQDLTQRPRSNKLVAYFYPNPIHDTISSQCCFCKGLIQLTLTRYRGVFPIIGIWMHD